MRFVTVSLPCVERELQRERAAASRLAVHANGPAMPAHDVIDNGESEAGALRPGPGIGLDAEELAEDLALHPHGNADPAVADADDPEAVGAPDLDGDVAMLGRVLHGV